MPQPISLIEEQQRLRRDGKVRLGQTVSGKRRDGSDYTRPVALTKWRLTSANRSALLAAAKIYGGEVKPWDSEPGQFELYTESEELFVKIWERIPSPCYEFWGKGGRLRRCGGDGSTCEVVEGEGPNAAVVERPCFCESLPEKQRCSMIMRFSFQLAGVPSLGSWTLDTGSIYAALEMPPVVNLLLEAKGRGGVLCVLAIEPREETKAGETKKFVVPVIRLREGMRDELAARGGKDMAVLVLTESAAALPAPSEIEGAEPIGRSLPPVSQLTSVADLNPNPEKGEVGAGEEDEFDPGTPSPATPTEAEAARQSDLFDLCDDYGVKSAALDWVKAQAPSFEEAKKVFEIVKANGNSLLGKLLAHKDRTWADLVKSVGGSTD